jgi:hypothetical protein
MQKVQTTYVCDYDGRDIPDGEPHYTRTFRLDGRDFETDLCQKHNGALAELLQPFLGRPVPRRRGAPTRPPRQGKHPGSGNRAGIRDWARERGMKVSDHGRIPFTIVRQWEQSHA